MTDNAISHNTMLNIFNDLSPFKNAFIYGYLVIWILGGICSYFMSDYMGYTPFSRSMELATSKQKLYYDLFSLYFFCIFCFINIKYINRGVSIDIKNEFKKAQRNQPKKISELPYQDPKKAIKLTSLFVMGIPILCFIVFVICSNGNGRTMQKILQDSSIYFYIYLVLGFIGNIYSVIYSILLMEMRNYVVFNS